MARKDEAPSMKVKVTCAWCKQQYKPAYAHAEEGMTQGCDCACEVTEKEGVWFVQGHYGSGGYDCERWRFVKNAPTENADPVCDACIKLREAAGDLELVPGQYPWGLHADETL